jgi:hypothetical protein
MNHFGIIRGFERIKIGSERIFFRIQGIIRDRPNTMSRHQNVSKPNASDIIETIPQLVLHCSSKEVGLTYLRMIRRCLTVTRRLSDLNQRDELKSISLTMPFVPGGGAAEFGWSLFWEQVAQSLSDYVNDAVIDVEAIPGMTMNSCRWRSL